MADRFPDRAIPAMVFLAIVMMPFSRGTLIRIPLMVQSLPLRSPLSPCNPSG